MSERIERLRELLEEPLLITNPVNVLYLTGLDSSNVDGREEWRRESVVSDLVAARFVGHGPDGYKMALEHLKEHHA